jgi:hypothetical protein
MILAIKLVLASAALASLLIVAATRGEEGNDVKAAIQGKEDGREVQEESRPLRKSDRLLVEEDKQAEAVKLLKDTWLAKSKEESAKKQTHNYNNMRQRDICDGRGRRYYRKGKVWRCKRK